MEKNSQARHSCILMNLCFATFRRHLAFRTLLFYTSSDPKKKWHFYFLQLKGFKIRETASSFA